MVRDLVLRPFEFGGMGFSSLADIAGIAHLSSMAAACRGPCAELPSLQHVRQTLINPEGELPPDTHPSGREIHDIIGALHAQNVTADKHGPWAQTFRELLDGDADTITFDAICKTIK